MCYCWHTIKKRHLDDCLICCINRYDILYICWCYPRVWANIVSYIGVIILLYISYLIQTNNTLVNCCTLVYGISQSKILIPVIFRLFHATTEPIFKLFSGNFGSFVNLLHIDDLNSISITNVRHELLNILNDYN